MYGYRNGEEDDIYETTTAGHVNHGHEYDEIEKTRCDWHWFRRSDKCTDGSWGWCVIS